MVNELLCPAGNLEAVKVAIRYGADAVYCAGKRFGARSFIANLTDEEIVEAAAFVHLHSKKIYITVNTLVFEDEFDELREYIDFLYHHVDALIVQDYGIVHYVRSHYPDFPVHISTQCSIHNKDDLRFLKGIGVQRVVLAREVPLEEIREFQKEGIELEVFIHGALCFCYSGMCYLSYYKGGRSGNRGSCAQPCRQRYELLEDGNPIEEGPLFSMKDLNTIDRINDLLSLGVASLKIEGRAKSLEYLASVTRVYRLLIDSFNEGKKAQIPQEYLDDLYASFSREKTKGYLFGEDNSAITTSGKVNHQGILIGKVISQKGKRTQIKLTKPLELHDGIRIVFGSKEIGLTVTKIEEKGNLVKMASDQATLEIEERVPNGASVFKTSSAKVKKELETFDFSKKSPAKLSVNIGQNRQSIRIEVGQILVEKEFDELLERANSDKSELVKAQFAKTNKLPIGYQEISIDNPGYFLPIPFINRMRGEALEELRKKLEGQRMRTFVPYPFQDSASLYSQDRGAQSLKLDEGEIYENLIDHSPLSHRHFAFHLSEIGGDSIVSPYFGICNLEAIKFFRNLTKGTLILSYESTIENSAKLASIDANLGYLEEFHEPLMVANHCPVGKHYCAKNKHCHMCESHSYTVKDGEREYSLRFHDCTMFLLGKKISRKGSASLVSVSFIEKP